MGISNTEVLSYFVSRLRRASEFPVCIREDLSDRLVHLTRAATYAAASTT